MYVKKITSFCQVPKRCTQRKIAFFLPHGVHTGIPNKKLCYHRREEMCQSKFCNFYNSVGTSCTSNQEQIEVMELKGYIRPTCNKLCVSSHDAHDRHRCNPHARPSTTLTTSLTCSREIFIIQSLEQSSRGKHPYFRRYPNFLKTQFRIGQRKLPCQKLALSSRFDTIPACDGRPDRQTDGHMTWAYTTLT